MGHVITYVVPYIPVTIGDDELPRALSNLVDQQQGLAAVSAGILIEVIGDDGIEIAVIIDVRGSNAVEVDNAARAVEVADTRSVEDLVVGGEQVGPIDESTVALIEKYVQTVSIGTKYITKSVAVDVHQVAIVGAAKFGFESIPGRASGNRWQPGREKIGAEGSPLGATLIDGQAVDEAAVLAVKRINIQIAVIFDIAELDVLRSAGHVPVGQTHLRCVTGKRHNGEVEGPRGRNQKWQTNTKRPAKKSRTACELPRWA